MVVIPAGNPSPWTGPTGNNTYLFPGRTPALIDAGVGNPTHVEAIASALSDRALEVILLTHAHSDHASGLPALRERWPRAIVRPASQTLSDGDAIDAGDGVLIAIHTPGHSPDHFCFLDRETNDVFCGDLARVGGTIVIPAGRGGDLAAYLASLQRVRDLRPKRLWPGHGPVVDDPLRLIDQYVEHRRTREAQIVDALRRGLSSRAEIVRAVYPNLPETLAAAASETVLAHLRKLEQDSVARVIDDRWALKED